MMSRDAIVLAGGFGTRLRAVVPDAPKPLAPVAGRPFLAWVLDSLAGAGMRRIVLATGYRAADIERMVGAHWSGMEIVYSVETTPLGTGGAIKQACARLVDPAGVHVLNGDTFLRYDPRDLEDAVADTGCAVAMALASVDDVSRYGAVDWREGRVVGFREKGEMGAGLINAGAYYLTRPAIEALPAVAAFSFESDVLYPAARAGAVCGCVGASDFIDIGVPDDYGRAQTLFASR